MTITERHFRSRRSPVFVSGIVALTLLLIVVSGIRSDWGVRGSIIGVDWAHHMALVEVLEAGRDPASAPIGEMSRYPTWTARTAVVLSDSLDISPLRAYQLVSAIAVAMLAVAIAARAFLGIRAGSTGFARAAGCVAIGAGLAMVAAVRLGLTDMMHLNAFWAQAFGMALAYAAIVGVQLIRPGPWILAILAVVIAGIVLPNVHLAPAVWVGGTICLCILFSPASPRTVVPVVAATVAILAICWYLNDHVQAIIDASANNGYYGWDRGNLSEQPTVVWAILGFAVLGVIFSLSAIVLSAADHGIDISDTLSHLRATRFEWAGAVVAVGMMAFSLADLKIHGAGSWYSVAKWAALVVVESIILFGTAVAVLVSRVPAPRHFYRTPGNRRIGQFVGAGLTLMAMTLVSRPLLETNYDQSDLIYARTAIIDHGIDEARALESQLGIMYPQTAMGSMQNYYLAIGVFGKPRDERTFRWLLSGTTNQRPYPATFPSGLQWDRSNPRVVR